MAIIGKQRVDEPSYVPPRDVPNAADAHTILGREAKFNGKLIFEGAVRIDGKFEGEIVTEDLLLIGPNAEVRAQLHVGSVVINGQVEGDIFAKSQVEIKAPGRLRGNVTTPTLIIERGVLFDGTCKMAPNGLEASAPGASLSARPTSSA